MRTPKPRLDSLLVERGYFDSREKAQRAILAGEVLLNNQRADKPGHRVSPDATLLLKEKSRFVSRGGLKLEAALEAFQINPAGQLCVDIGASTGGFTDCLLQRGARQVYALDVGHGQLDWKIRSDERVIVREKLNARYLAREDFAEPPALAAIDVSFISLTLVLPPICAAVAAPGGIIIALIKPQYELGREEADRGAGVIRDTKAHARAVEKIQRFVAESLHSWHWRGFIDSPITGAEGNREFLACLQS